MIDKQSKIYVNLDLATNQVKIVPVATYPNGREFLFPDRDKEGFKWESFTLEADKLFPVENEKYMLRIDSRMAKELRDELIKVFGHPEKPAMQAELDATKYHLEDMRKLVFEGKTK